MVTYGEVAVEAGWPGRSRAVGRVLATGGGAFPWWRVVNAAGRLVPGHEAEQARRLADEGVPTQCERDVYGAVTMLLLEALGSGTTYLVDTVELEAERNVVRLWHCGSAATELAADPARATQSLQEYRPH